MQEKNGCFFAFKTLISRNYAGMSLEKSVLKLLDGANPSGPLPTTRELGERFGVSHVTVSRVLRRLADSGTLWQADSGRFYKAERALARARPVGCLVRSLSAWAAWYEGIMTGVGRACEAEGRGILVHPITDFVKQSGPGEAASFLSDQKQQAILSHYLDRHLKETERLLLDDSWSDAVLQREATRLRSACILLRPSPVAGMDACFPDYAQGALLGLSHLLGCNYREIIFVQPYDNYATTKQMEQAFSEVFRSLSASSAKFQVFQSRGAEAFPELIGQLKSKREERVALVCPEDNFSVVLLRALRESGITVPGSVGLLGGMGTGILADAGISRLSVDFEALGECAVTSRFSSQSRPCINFKLQAGDTT